MTARVLVAGIGNMFLGDDGFGPEVARRYATRSSDPGVRVVDYGIRGMHLAYDLLDPWDALILVDALPTRTAAGVLHVFEPDRVDTVPGLDAHGMDPATVFASLRALGGTLPYTVIVGCEVADVRDGIGLSYPVAAALEDAVEHVAAQVNRLARAGSVG